MTRRGRAAGATAAAITGGILVGALSALAPGGTATAWAASECDHVWSVSYTDGSPITSSALFADELIVPGANLDGDFVVTTGRDITGPLELRAVRARGAAALDPALEGEIQITLTGSSRAVTLPLSALLNSAEPLRVVDELSPGSHDIGVRVQLPFDSTNTSQLRDLPFQLVVTVSDMETVVGEAPAPCPSVPGGGDSGGGDGGSSGAGGDPSALASTGTETGANVAWAAALLGAGFATVLAARRRRRTISGD
ncbi:hypothetical protein ASC66_15625 [Leifsonia sp. Root4]|uniref:LPXTG cell wall anchor domain-containing protein n=1 Tax=Leifsonia sp. Root4 TaxID=1736525 RepID=UPI0006FC1689|nr:LPXTG cell wall anchor domain-containing protein [Leifsonia sp. Root4]KQW05094.1 hypothetical protein ASC66_15625 [Leifsonia sp. Root4]